MNALRIALPTGALFADSCVLLRDAGVPVPGGDPFARSLLLDVEETRLVKVRPTDVPVYVEMGACDCGIVGKDVLWESPRTAYELVDLRFGACRLVLAAPYDSPLAQGDWPPQLRVATKYPRAARRFFDTRGVAVELIKLHGSVELAPLAGLTDAVVDITATGETMRANGLVEIAEAGRSTARLIVNHTSLKMRSDLVNQLAATLRRAAEARTAGSPLSRAVYEHAVELAP